MTAPTDCPSLGRGQIVKADLWDYSYLDLVSPAMLVIGADNHGEIDVGTLQASLTMASITWTGFEKMDEVNGDSHAELLDDGIIEFTCVCQNDDEAILKAQRESSSTAF